MAIDGNVLDSFWVKLGFVTDQEGIEKFEAAMEGMRGFALALGGVLTGAAAGIGLFVEGVAKSLGDMEHFAKVNKLTTDELQAFNAIARENHIDVGAMDQGIAELNKNLGLAQLGSGRLKPILEKLGIGLKDAHGHAKNFRDILDEVADKMQKFEKAGAGATNIGLARRLGLDPGMVELLNKGADSWRKTFADAQSHVAFSREDLERAEETDKLFVRTKHDVEALWDRIALYLMPAIDKLLERFTKWFDKMSHDPTSLVNRSLHAMGAVADWVGDHLGLLTNIAIPLLIAAFAALSSAATIALGKMAIAAALSVGSMVEQLGALTIAEIIALAPVELIVAGIALLAVAAYEVYEHWNGIILWFGHALNWIVDQVDKVGHAIDGALVKAFHLFGGGDGHTMNVVHQAASGNFHAPAWNGPGSSAAWGAHNTSRSQATTIVHHVSGTTINISSPDPSKAGEAVSNVLKPKNTRTLIRNSQSGLVY